MASEELLQSNFTGGRQIQRSGSKCAVYWDIINQHRSNKTNANDPGLDVDSLNDFFINVPKVVTSDLPNIGVKFIEYLHNIDVSSMHSFAFKHVSYIQVRDALKALHNKKSRDYYGLTADVN